MVVAVAESTSLVVVSLPCTPYSVRRARFYVRTELNHHDLDGYTEDVEVVTSELVSNAVTHTDAPAFGLELLLLSDGSGVVVVVTDPSPLPPIMSGLTPAAEHGRGLRVVDALSSHWGWASQGSGKVVFAIVAREG